jgi:hypothetical protein
MQRWVLDCFQCKAELPHSQVHDGDFSGSDPYSSLTKPKFPDGGLSVLCPYSKIISVLPALSTHSSQLLAEIEGLGSELITFSRYVQKETVLSDILSYYVDSSSFP